MQYLRRELRVSMSGGYTSVCSAAVVVEATSQLLMHIAWLEAVHVQAGRGLAKPPPTCLTRAQALETLRGYIFFHKAWQVLLHLLKLTRKASSNVAMLVAAHYQAGRGEAKPPSHAPDACVRCGGTNGGGCQAPCFRQWGSKP